MIFDKINSLLGFVKLLIYKVLYWNRIKVNGIVKIKKDCNIIIDKKSRVSIGKKVRIRNNCTLRSEKGGVIEIGDGSFLNSNISITSLEKITLGENVSIGPNVVIVDHDHDYKNDFKRFITSPVNIGNNVWIGSNVVILKGVTIGNGALIGAGTIVKNDVPENSLYMESKEYFRKKIRMAKDDGKK